MSTPDFIEKAKGLSSNPLGIIALFISLLYGLGTIVLSTNIANLNNANEKLPVIWFIILFPLIILAVFTYLVVKHHEKLYGPKDYISPESFEKTFGNKYNSKQISITEETINPTHKDAEISKPSLFLSESEDQYTKRIEIIDQANIVIEFITFKSKELFKKKLISSIGISIQSPKFYIFSFKYSIKMKEQEQIDTEESAIIQIEYKYDNYIFLLIGKSIIAYSAKDFGEKLIEYTKSFILNKRKEIEEL